MSGGRAQLSWPHAGATFSPCGAYRYVLWRAWSDKPRALWIMLNPSTADESVEDPTIRRCIGFARSWGLGGVYIANAFALRSTDPRVLYRSPDPVGPLNDWVLRVLAAQVSAGGGPIVSAWGHHAQRLGRELGLLQLLNHRPLSCLHRTQSRAPGHPLYLRADAELRPYP